MWNYVTTKFQRCLKKEKCLKKIQELRLNLLLVHVDIALDIVIAANLIEFRVGEGVLLDEEHQFVDLLLLVEEIHVGRLTSEMECVRHA